MDDQQKFYNAFYAASRDIEKNHIQSLSCATQAALETGWGKSMKGNNPFGIKAGSSWKGATIDMATHEYVNGKRVNITDRFRAYPTIGDAVADYFKTLEAKWPATYNAKTIEDAANGLLNGVHGAYATDPSYRDNFIVTAEKRAPLAKAHYEQGERPEPEDFGPPNPKSSILPTYRPQQDEATTRAVLEHYAHLTPPNRQDDPVKVLVVRGYFLNSMGKSGKNDRAIYDDAVFVVTPEGVQPFNGNSDPSVFKHRVATLKAPQAVRYVPGLHGISRGGGYPAFRQDSNVTVVRDGIGDDRDKPEARFWINLHRGGVNGTSSLGCLTVPKHQWNEFHSLVSGLLAKYGQKTFYVTLVEYAGGHPPVSVPDAKGSAAAAGAAAGAAGAGVAAGSASASSGLSLWLWIVLTVVLLVALAGVVYVAWRKGWLKSAADWLSGYAQRVKTRIAGKVT